MRKYISVVFLVFLMIPILSGCLPSNEVDEFAFPEVSFTISSAEVNVGEPILFDAFVSVEGKPIVDADRVEFEVWHEDEEDGEHESILIDHSGEGHYKLEKSFDKPGTYYIYYHIDTMALHLMEKFDFIVK